MPKEKSEWLYGLVYEGLGQTWVFVVDKKPLTKLQVVTELHTFLNAIEQKAVTLKGIKIRRSKKWTLS